MKIDKKKLLAARVLGVGRGSIRFHPSRLPEIAEAITRQDFRDLITSGAIALKEARGRKKNERKQKRGFGKIKKKVKRRKREYMLLTRKLRAYVKELLKQGKISRERYLHLRKQIRARIFKSKAHLQSILTGK